MTEIAEELLLESNRGWLARPLHGNLAAHALLIQPQI